MSEMLVVPLPKSSTSGPRPSEVRLPDGLSSVGELPNVAEKRMENEIRKETEVEMPPGDSEHVPSKKMSSGRPAS